MVILVVFNSFNVVKNLKKPDLVARQKPPFYTTKINKNLTLKKLLKNLKCKINKNLTFKKSLK